VKNQSAAHKIIADFVLRYLILVNRPYIKSK